MSKVNSTTLLKKFLAHVDEKSDLIDYVPATVTSGFNKDEIDYLFALRDKILADKASR